MCVRLPDDGREEDGSFSGSAAAAAAYNVQVFSSILLLVTSRGACSHGLAPPGRRRRRRSSRTQLTAPVVVGWWIASCASPIWTCTRKSMSTPLLYVYVHTYIHVPCSTGSPPYHPRTQSTYSILWCPPFPEGDSGTVKMYMYQQSALNGKIHSIFQRRRRGTYLVIKQGPARTTSVSNVIE